MGTMLRSNVHMLLLTGTGPTRVQQAMRRLRRQLNNLRRTIPSFQCFVLFFVFHSQIFVSSAAPTFLVSTHFPMECKRFGNSGPASVPFFAHPHDADVHDRTHEIPKE